MSVDRRAAMKAVGATLGAAAFARALAPLTEWTDDLSVDEFLQRHYKELTRDEMQAVLRRHEEATEREYGAKVTIEDVRPTPGVSFGYVLPLALIEALTADLAHAA